MKKTIIILSLLLTTIIMSTAQKLIDIYQKGTVKLTADLSYAQNNDWDKVFETYYDTLYNRPMGNRKSIIMLPDNSIVVNHAYKNYYSLFDSKGKFVKEFGVKNSSGKQFKKTNSIEGIINNNFFTGLDNMGKMLCFDFDGNYIKTLTINYMAKGMVPLKNNKIAVVGWVIWDTKFRDFVAIVDYNTNEEKIIWDHFTSRCKEDTHCELFNYGYNFEKGGAFRFTTMPYSKNVGLTSPPEIQYVNDRLIIALPTTGEILTFDINGNKLSTKKIEWGKNYISVEEQKEIQQKAIENFISRMTPPANWIPEPEYTKARETILTHMQEDLQKIKDPLPVPVFSTIIKDSDDNLLFFEIPKEENANKFNVWIYKENGTFVCQSSLQCEDYNLAINPSKMIFKDGYIYALQTLKESEGNPLRLVRFKISN